MLLGALDGRDAADALASTLRNTSRESSTRIEAALALNDLGGAAQRSNAALIGELLETQDDLNDR